MRALSHTAAVVGVILNLAVWFGLHVLFRGVRAIEAGPLALDAPVLASANWPSLLLAAVAAFRFRVGGPSRIAGCAALSVGFHLAGWV